jgi:hypothetical protein
MYLVQVDTARVYGLGTSEEYLGKIGWQERGLVMDTKLFATSPIPAVGLADGISHRPGDLKKHLLASLKALNAECVLPSSLSGLSFICFICVRHAYADGILSCFR